MNDTKETQLPAPAPLLRPITAVLWDFGGVVLTSPFQAFEAYEKAVGLPKDTIRKINSTNPNTNAWAKFERSEVSMDEFCELFAAEGRAIGCEVDGRRLAAMLDGEVRPQMVEAIKRCKAAGFKLGCLTNNFSGENHSPRQTTPAEQTPSSEVPNQRRAERDAIFALFDHVTESRITGVRKPERRFYEMACDAMGITPHDAVFLDDLGINLKPARELGMRTIKVGDPDVAIDELAALLGLALK